MLEALDAEISRAGAKYSEVTKDEYYQEKAITTMSPVLIRSLRDQNIQKDDYGRRLKDYDGYHGDGTEMIRIFGDRVNAGSESGSVNLDSSLAKKKIRLRRGEDSKSKMKSFMYSYLIYANKVRVYTSFPFVTTLVSDKVRQLKLTWDEGCGRG